MSSSFHVNYKIRPKKSIQRKMIMESFRHLGYFNDLANYQYIGLGGHFFSEYHYLHKDLHLNKLISIEKNTNNKKRFELNKPYDFVKIFFGASNKVLKNEVNLLIPTIAWLDYDGVFNVEILEDVCYLAQSLPAGSVFLISFNVECMKPKEELENLNYMFGDKVPYGTKIEQMSKSKYPLVIREIVDTSIKKEISFRNNLYYKQLYFFKYKDSVDMVTIGGIILDSQEHNDFSSNQIHQLDFIRKTDAPYIINPPALTLRELANLNQGISESDKSLSKKLSIPEKHIKEYKKIYKYYSHYNEATHIV